MLKCGGGVAESGIGKGAVIIPLCAAVGYATEHVERLVIAAEGNVVICGLKLRVACCTVAAIAAVAAVIAAEGVIACVSAGGIAAVALIRAGGGFVHYLVIRGVYLLHALLGHLVARVRIGMIFFGKPSVCRLHLVVGGGGGYA